MGIAGAKLTSRSPELANGCPALSLHKVLPNKGRFPSYGEYPSGLTTEAEPPPGAEVAGALESAGACVPPVAAGAGGGAGLFWPCGVLCGVVAGAGEVLKLEVHVPVMLAGNELMLVTNPAPYLP